MTLRLVRIGVAVLCAAGIVGMVVGSVADNNGAAVTSGLIAAVAVVVLMAFTVATRTALASLASAAPDGSVDEARAQRIEYRVQELVSAGADEAELRALVGEAVRLGRGH